MKRTVLLVCLGLAIALPLSAKEPRLQGTIDAHTNAVKSVVFSPDGATLASGGSGPAVRLWNVATGKNIATVDADGLFGCLAFNGNGNAIAAMWGADDQTIELWDVATRTKISTIDEGSKLDSVVNPGGSITVTIGSLPRAAFSPDGRIVAWGSFDRMIRLRDVTAGKNIATLQNARSGNPLVFGPDGKRLASALTGRIMFWDVATGKSDLSIAVDKHALAMTFSPDGKILAYAGEAPSLQYSRAERPLLADTNSAITLWDTATGQRLATFSGHPQFTFALAFSPDGETLASGGLDGSIKLWEAGSRQSTAVLEGHAEAVVTLAFSPDGKTLASGDAGGTVKWWDVTSFASSGLPSSNAQRPTDHGD